MEAQGRVKARLPEEAQNLGHEGRLPPTQPFPHTQVLGESMWRGALWLTRPLPCRIHAEFQLSEPPDFPFWFSPGQFTGHIILSKDATHVRDFRLFVPNHR